MNENQTLRQLQDEMDRIEAETAQAGQPEQDIPVSANEDEMKLYWSLKLSA